MHTLRIPLTLFLLATVSSCTGRDPVTPDQKEPQPPISSRTVLMAATGTEVFGTAGEEVPQLPLVRVINSPENTPVANVLVTFTKNGGTNDVYAVMTNEKGYARLDSWRLGDPGEYTVTAAAAGLNAVTFIAVAQGPVIAVYDLVSVGGRKAPWEYITGGHYVLYAGGVYSWAYNRSASDPLPSTPSGRYWSSTGMVQFYVPATTNNAFYQQRNGLFSSGTLDGSTMRVTYQDFIDFEDEVYQLRH